MNDDARDLILRTLKGIESELIRRAGLARTNALLGLADPALVLPSPSVGLLAVETRRAIHIGPSTVFRSLEPLCADGEVLLAPTDPEAVVHPWEVRSASWQVPGTVTQEDSAVARPLVPRLRIALSRPDDAAGSVGWLFLWVPGGECLRWALPKARVFCDGFRLPSRSPAAPPTLRDASGSDLSVTLHHLQAACDNLLLVEIPYHLAARREIALDVFFPEGLVPDDHSTPAVVIANVIPVWNSLDCRAPGFHEIESAAAGHGSRLVHPLVPESLGAAWMAWSVLGVGAATDARLTISDFHVACLPEEDAHPGTARALPHTKRIEGALVPCVVLTRQARERLDEAQARLEITYRATMGTRAGALPTGTEFRMLDTSGLPGREQVIGRLVSQANGASDGILDDLAETDNAARLISFQPRAARRTIGDLVRLFERSFGRDLQLVDERDLLRTDDSGTVAPLTLRVRVRQAGLPAAERAMLLRSCGALLRRYLAGDEGGTLRVVEQRE